MASASNMRELQNIIARQMNRAMANVSREAEDALEESTQEFYSGGSPTRYRRTGELGKTPNVDPIRTTSSGSCVETSFRAYYDTSHQYTTGRAPSMRTVLDLANRGEPAARQYHLRENVGQTGFIDNAYEKIENALDNELSKYFTKV